MTDLMWILIGFVVGYKYQEVKYQKIREIEKLRGEIFVNDIIKTANDDPSTRT